MKNSKKVLINLAIVGTLASLFLPLIASAQPPSFFTASAEKKRDGYRRSDGAAQELPHANLRILTDHLGLDAANIPRARCRCTTCRPTAHSEA